MATNFPTSLDDTTSMPTRASGNTIPSSDNNDKTSAIIAVEGKLGTGATTPTTTNKVLYGSGAGASTWGTAAAAGLAAASHTHVATTDLTATGTKNSTTFLRGDNTWAAPAGGSGLSAVPASYLLAGTTRAATGRWFLANEVTVNTWATVAINQGTTYYVPFYCGRNMTLDSLGMSVSTSEAGTSIRCAIYSNSAAGDPYPASQLAGSDTGVLSGTSTGFKYASGLNLSLSAGNLYWMAFVADGGSGTLACHGPAVSNVYSPIGHALDSGTAAYCWQKPSWETTGSALSATAPTGAVTSGSNVPAPVFRLSA